MPTRDEVQALLDKVRNATRGDVEIDVAILCAFPPFGFDWKPDPKWKHRATFKHSSGDIDGRTSPSYTYHLDAVLALIEREFPKEWPKFIRTSMQEMSRDFHWHTNFPAQGSLSLLPIYLCAAFLSAKLQEGS